MDLYEACSLLHVSEYDSPDEIKSQYHRLIRRFHPDNGRESENALKVSQQLNEAYAVLRQHAKEMEEAASRMAFSVLAEETCRHIYCPRNVYREHLVDVGTNMGLRRLSSGRYLWNPEAETFSSLAFSVNEAAGNLLQAALYERKIDPEYLGYAAKIHLQEMRTRLFHLLIQEFIDPWQCIDDLLRLNHVDEAGNSVYFVPCFAKICGAAQIHALEKIQADDPPRSQDTAGGLFAVLSGSHISAATARGDRLFDLSFEDDGLYYVITPILSDPHTSARLTILSIRAGRHSRPMNAHISCRLALTIPDMDYPDREPSIHRLNAQIRALLGQSL